MTLGIYGENTQEIIKSNQEFIANIKAENNRLALKYTLVGRFACGLCGHDYNLSQGSLTEDAPESLSFQCLECVGA